MTTIQCSSTCIHQTDGQCTLDTISSNFVSTSTDCVYYDPKPQKKTTQDTK